MANASTVGFGLRAINTVGQTPATSGQAEYKFKQHQALQSTKVILCLHKMQAIKVIQQDAAFTLTDDGGAGGAGWDSNDADARLLTGVFNGAFF